MNPKGRRPQEQRMWWHKPAPSKYVSASQVAEIGTPISYEHKQYPRKFLCGRLHTAADHSSLGSHVALSICQTFKIYLERDDPLLFSQQGLDLTSACFLTWCYCEVCAKVLCWDSMKQTSETPHLIKRKNKIYYHVQHSLSRNCFLLICISSSLIILQPGCYSSATDSLGSHSSLMLFYCFLV